MNKAMTLDTSNDKIYTPDNRELEYIEKIYASFNGAFRQRKMDYLLKSHGFKGRNRTLANASKSIKK